MEMATIDEKGNVVGTGSIIPSTPAAPITPPPATTPPQVTPPVQPPMPPGTGTATTPPATTVPATTLPTTPTPAPTDTTQTTDTTDPQAKALADEQAQRTANAQEYFNIGKQASDAITNIQNGTTPLTAGEHAQLDGLKSQLDQTIQDQIKANENLLQGTKLLAAREGRMQYAPKQYLQDIHDVVSKGLTKVSNLQMQEAASIAKLTQDLKNNDISAVKDAYAAYQDASKARSDALQQTITETQDAIKTQQQYQLDVAKFQQTGDQNAFDNALKTEQAKEAERHNKATEAIDAFKAGQGAGGGSNGITQSAELTPSGAPDPVSQKAVLDQITQKYGPMTAQAIQGLTDYTINPADWSSRAGTKGLSRADAVSLAQMYDPTYSDTNYAIRASYLKSIASTQTGTVGSAVNSANKAINHLTAFVTSMGKTPNGPIGFLNSFDNALTLNQGVRQNLAAAQTEGLGVAEELAKFFKGSGTVDVASIDAWKSQLSTSASPASVAGLTQGAITLLAGQLQTLTEQYQNTMGKAPETDFLNASARASLSSLKNQGYTVDIPGINYTDKAAYIKYDPSAQANMTTAIDRLTKAGLPVTPENILQMAQTLDSSPEQPTSFNSVGGDTNQALNRPTKNNNPGNIKMSEATSTYEGVTGTDPKVASDGGKFLTFATPQDGFNAMGKLLSAPSYNNLTVDQAMKRWSNSGYGGEIAPALKNKTISSLTPAEKDFLIKSMAKREGYNA